MKKTIKNKTEERTAVRLKPEIRDFLKKLAVDKRSTIAELLEDAATKHYKIPAA